MHIASRILSFLRKQIFRSSEKTDENKWVTLERRGFYSLLFGDFREADRLLSESIELGNQKYSVYGFRGRARTLLNSFEPALWDFDQALRRNKDAFELYFYRGDLLRRTREYPDAIMDLTNFIEHTNRPIVGYEARGLCYASLNQHEHAINDFERAIALDPKDSHLFLIRGQSYRSLCRYTEAKKDFDKALEIDPGYGEAYYQRGILYIQIQDRNNALVDIARAADLRVGKAEAMLTDLRFEEVKRDTGETARTSESEESPRAPTSKESTQTQKSEASRASGRSRRQYNTEELADNYVKSLRTLKKPKLSQTELERVTGVDQSTWSRAFRRLKFWEETQTRVNEDLDLKNIMSEAFREINTRIEDLGKRNRQVYKEMSIEPDTIADNSELPQDVAADDVLINKLCKKDLIEEIQRHYPKIDKDKLNDLSEEELRRVYKELG